MRRKASQESSRTQTDYRNPVTAEAMATLGYVASQDASRSNGNPPAEFTFDPSHVLAAIRRNP